MEDGELNLDPAEVPGDEAATPPADPAAPPAAPAFSLEIDDRTKYTDPDQAKRGFTELRGDRDRHKSRSETLEEENKRLKVALGGDPTAGKPKSSLTPEDLAKQRDWLQRVKPELGVMTIDDLDRPEVQAALERIVEKREQDQLVARGNAHVTKTLAKHGIELSPAKRAALNDYLGGVIGHEESVELAQRFMSGDMAVLDELIEDHFAAHIKSRADAAAATQATQLADRDRRGRFAKVEEAKDKMKRLVPAAPPKGGAAAVSNTPPEKLDTPEKRRKRMAEMLEQMAS